MDVMSLIEFSHDAIGIDKPAAVVIILFIFVFKIIKTRIDRYKEDKKGRASEFIFEIERNSKPKYRIVVEQNFQNRFGILIDYPAITFLTKQKTPSADIIDYVIGRKYLEFNNDYSALSYRGKYTEGRLKVVKKLYLFMYYITASIGFLLLDKMADRPFNSNGDISMYLLTIVALLFIAYLSIDESLKPQSAIDLIKRKQSQLN